MLLFRFGASCVEAARVKRGTGTFLSAGTGLANSRWGLNRGILLSGCPWGLDFKILRVK